MFLYTRSVPTPKFKEVRRQYRFMIRLAQLVIAAGSFVSLAISTFNVNYSYAILGVSGVNLTVLVAISSMLVSCACIFLYRFPAFLGVPPHRHLRFSRIECAVDFVYIAFWLAAASTVALYRRCPRVSFNLNFNFNFSSRDNDKAEESCLPWYMCFSLGYLCAALFGGTFVMGVKDLWEHGLFRQGGYTYMGTRGSWRDWGNEQTAATAGAGSESKAASRRGRRDSK
ncbi:hypothetical protein HK102_011123 [Quaeritorhiza haematococci]|nr:hypothetical protein HK102_011123 [Quaeritorhiza haematococci]